MTQPGDKFGWDELLCCITVVYLAVLISSVLGDWPTRSEQGCEKLAREKVFL